MHALDSLATDLRDAFRSLKRAPAFSLAAVATLTLGIGAATGIFSVVNTVLLGQIAAPDPERIIVFMTASPQGSMPMASPAKFWHFRNTTRDVVRDTSALRVGAVGFSGTAIVEQLQHGEVSSDFFTLFGVRFVEGRGFTAREDAPGGPDVVVLSKPFWESRFAGDREIIGRTLRLGDSPYEVVGILDEFPFLEFGISPDVWTPMRLAPDDQSQAHYFQAVGRLAPGVTLEHAQAVVRASTTAYRAEYARVLPRDAVFDLERLEHLLVQNVRPSLLVLSAAVALLLLIACANVMNLMLARSEKRRYELAVRGAVGATRGRLLRQLLIETALLSLTAGVFGLLLGFIAMRALLSVNTANLPRVGEGGSLVGLDWRVALFALALCAATAVLAGLVPALRASRLAISLTPHEPASSFPPLGRGWLGKGVVVVELALTLTLLVGAGVLIRSAVALANVDRGFDGTNVLTMRTALGSGKFSRSVSVARAVREVSARVEATPGVEAVSTTCCMPLDGPYVLPFSIWGRPTYESPFHGVAAWMSVSPGYFDVLRIPVTRGRGFEERDREGNLPVAVINETMARLFWPDSDPLEGRVVIAQGVMAEFATEVPRTVIGVVGNTREGGLQAGPTPAVYVPQAQVPDAVNALTARLAPLVWLVRTTGQPGHLRASVAQDIVKATGAPVTSVHTMDSLLSRSTSRQRFNMWLMSMAGGVAVLLAGVGVYGVLAYSVSRRRRELGIRLALGAQPAQVRRLVALAGVGLVAAGIALGLTATFFLTRLLDALVFGLSARDPWTFTLATAFLVSVSAAAVWVPVRRAGTADPASTLRSD